MRVPHRHLVKVEQNLSQVKHQEAAVVYGSRKGVLNRLKLRSITPQATGLPQPCSWPSAGPSAAAPLLPPALSLAPRPCIGHPTAGGWVRQNLDFQPLDGGWVSQQDSGRFL